MTNALPQFCNRCGAALEQHALVCPECRQLVHGAELEQLAAGAGAAETAGRLSEAIEKWTRALAMLPPDTVQYRSIASHLVSLEAAQAAAREPGQSRSGRWKKLIAQLGIAGAVLWKLKAFVLLALTKGKFLLLGLTKLSTLGSMLVSLGVYWSWYGWKFALGFILSLYVHEMGHVLQLRRYGINSTAPLFLPGLGAVVLLKEKLPSVGADARVGLAGPIYGLGAAVACLLAGIAFSGSQLWMAVAHSGAQINLFNLIPIWQLDGGRGFRALTFKQRLMILGVTLGMWFFTGQSLFFLILLGIGYKLWTRDHAPQPDNAVLYQFVALLVVLGLLCMIPVQGPRGAN